MVRIRRHLYVKLNMLCTKKNYVVKLKLKFKHAWKSAWFSHSGYYFGKYIHKITKVYIIVSFEVSIFKHSKCRKQLHYQKLGLSISLLLMCVQKLYLFYWLFNLWVLIFISMCIFMCITLVWCFHITTLKCNHGKNTSIYITN